MSCNRSPATDVLQQKLSKEGTDILLYCHYGMCHVLFPGCSSSPWRKHDFCSIFTRRNVIFYYISTMKCVIFCFMVFQVSPKEASFLFNFSLDEESFLLYFQYGMCPFLFPGGSSSSQKKHRFYSTFY